MSILINLYKVIKSCETASLESNIFLDPIGFFPLFLVSCCPQCSSSLLNNMFNYLHLKTTHIMHVI